MSIRNVKSMSLTALPIIDEPYTSPDEDPFSVHSHLQEAQEMRNKTRRSSLLDTWIREQQTSPDPENAFLRPPRPPYARLGLGSSSNPYLAYPDLPRIPSIPSLRKDDSSSVQSYDFIEDDDIPSSPRGHSLEEPVTPKSPRFASSFKSGRNSISPSFRTLNFSLRSTSPESRSSHDMDGVSRALSKFSLFPRSPRSSARPAPISSPSTTPSHQSHNRAASLSPSQPTPRQSIDLPTPTSKWRPSAVGHLRHQASASMSSVAVSDVQSIPPRPSICSVEMFSSSNATTTTLDSGIAVTPTKASFFNSLRLRGNRSTMTVSSVPSPHRMASVNRSFISVQQGKETLSRRRPLSPKAGSILDNIDDEDDLDEPPAFRLKQTETSRPTPISYPSTSKLKRYNFSSIGSRSGKKKKKLIISGIAVTEVRKFEGMKRWCETFGEIKSITRMPNGDLQVDFRDPEVADTVCRIRAKVFIAGVGSVQLSWIVGNKR